MRSVHNVAFFVALTLVATVNAGSLHRRSRDTHLCKKLSPVTDSIPHANNDPSCNTQYPDYLYQSECICNFPVAESDANGCTTKYFVRCIKETSQKSAEPQAPEAPLSVPSGIDLSLGNDTIESNETEASTGAVESPAAPAEHAESVQPEGAVAANASVEAEVVLPEVATESIQFILPAAYSPSETAAAGNSSAENSSEIEEEKVAPAANTSAVSAPSETKVQAAPYGPTEKGASTSISKESTEKGASASASKESNSDNVVLPEATTESTQFILPAAYSPPETAAIGNSSAENSTESEEEKAAPATNTSTVSAPSETKVQAAPYGPTEKGASTSISKESTEKGASASASKESNNNEVVLPEVTTESTQFILPAAYSPPETAAIGNSSAENSTESEEEKAAPAASTSAVSAPSETNVQAASYGPTEKGASTSASKESTEKGASASASKESNNNEDKNVTVAEEKEAESLLSVDASTNSSSPSANNSEDSVPAQAYVSAAPNGPEASVSPSEDAVSEEPAPAATAENVEAASEAPAEASVSAAPYGPSQSAEEVSVSSEAVTSAAVAEIQDKAEKTIPAGAAESALAALEQEAAEVGGNTNVSEVVAEPANSYQAPSATAVAPKKPEGAQAETAEQVDEIAPAVTAAAELIKSENASAEATEQPEKSAEAPLVTSAAVEPEKPEGAPAAAAEDETQSATTAVEEPVKSENATTEVEEELEKSKAAPGIAVAIAPAKSEGAPAETAAETATTAAEVEEKPEKAIEAHSTTAAAVESNAPAEATEEPKENPAANATVDEPEKAVNVSAEVESPAKPESVSVQTEAQIEAKPVSSKFSIDVEPQQAKKSSVPDDQRCPVSNRGCIFDDEVEGTDCTVAGNAACRAVGASYCSAVFGSPAQRVCCKVQGVNQPKPNPDIAGCAPSNLGCIFDHDVEGSDCTKGGNSDCQKVGADYCGAEVEGRRVCCAIGNQTKPEFKEDGSETCPAKNGGCIFDHDVNGADCTEGGSKHCASLGSDYCSAKFGSPMKRVCCDISGVGAAPAGGDGSKACPVKNSGCIFDDSVSGVDCTTGGDASCKAAGLSYCSAFFGSPSKRVCCDISAVDAAQTDSLVQVSAQSSNVSLSSQEDQQPISINVSAKPY